MTEKELFDTLYKKYGSMTLSKEDAADVLGRSRSSMDNDRKAGKGVGYIQHTEGGAVRYPLHEVVKHLMNNTVKTA